MKSTAEQPKKRIYRASASFYEIEIKGPDEKPIGRLTIDPNALNALT